MEIKKRGFSASFVEVDEDKFIARTLHAMLMGGPTRKCREIPVSLTDEDRALHAEAHDLMARLEANPWTEYGPDGDIFVIDLPETEWVPDETDEEFEARLVEWEKSVGR